MNLDVTIHVVMSFLKVDEMISKEWELKLKDGTHTLKIEHGMIIRKYRVKFDERNIDRIEVVRIKKGNMLSFKIGSHEYTVLIGTVDICDFDYDLLLDGVSIQTGQQVAIPPEEKYEKKGCLSEFLLSIAGFILLSLVELIMGEKIIRLLDALVVAVILLVIGYPLIRCYLKHRKKSNI